jgi:hypothetical protein
VATVNSPSLKLVDVELSLESTNLHIGEKPTRPNCCSASNVCINIDLDLFRFALQNRGSGVATDRGGLDRPNHHNAKMFGAQSNGELSESYHGYDDFVKKTGGIRARLDSSASNPTLKRTRDDSRSSSRKRPVSLDKLHLQFSQDKPASSSSEDEKSPVEKKKSRRRRGKGKSAKVNSPNELTKQCSVNLGEKVAHLGDKNGEKNELSDHSKSVEEITINTSSELETEPDPSTQGIDSVRPTENSGSEHIQSETIQSENTIVNMEAKLDQLLLDIGSVKGDTKEIKTEITTLKNSQQFISDAFEDLKKDVKVVGERVGVVETSMTDCRTEIRELKDRLDQYEVKLARQDQYGRRDFVEIKGVAYAAGMDAEATLTRIFLACGISQSVRQLTSKCHWNPIRKFPNERYIVAKFISRNDRDAFVGEARTRRLTRNSIDNGSVEDMIFVNDFLNPYYKQLMGATRKAAKEKGYKYIFHQNEQIVVRKYDGGPKIFLEKMADIAEKIV